MSDNSYHDPESVVQEIKRKTCRKFSAEEKIRIVLDGLKGDENITALPVILLKRHKLKKVVSRGVSF